MKLIGTDKGVKSDASDDVFSGTEDELSPNENSNNEKGYLERELKQLNRVMRRESSILKQSVTSQRDKVRKQCENLLNVEEHRRYAFNMLWMHYWYAPVKAIAAKPKISDELQAWLKNFIICGVRHLDKISAKYTDLRPPALIFMGDLYRHSFVNCGRTETDFRKSQDDYLKSYCLNTGNGRPFNQLALLWQEAGDAWKSFGYFLKALTVKEPFARVLENIKRLNESDFDEKIGHAAAFNLICSLSLKFSRLNMEKWRRAFESALEANVEASEWKVALEMVYYLACISSFFNRSEEYDDQAQVSNIILCQSWSTLISHFFKSSNDDFLLSILACLGEFVIKLSQTLFTKKVPVSLKFQYKNVVQLYAELLNVYSDRIREAEIDPKELSLEKTELWIPDAPLVEGIEVVIVFLKSAIDSSFVPLSFDGEKFCVVSLNTAQIPERKHESSSDSSSGDSVDSMTELSQEKVKFMEKVGKLHAEFQQKEEQKKKQKSMLPVYLFPDVSVLLEKLSVLQNLATIVLSDNHRFIIIVAELVLGQLDRLKRENQRAREAIRWLQTALTSMSGKIRLNMIPTRDGDVKTAAYQFVESQNLLDRKSLFATVLTTKKPMEDKDCEFSLNGEDVFAKYTSLSMENVDAFFLRIVELEDGNTMS